MVVSEKVVGPHQTTPRISAKTPFIHNIHVLDSHITLVSESTSSSTIDGDSRDMVDEWLVKEEVAGIAGAASADNHKQRVRTVEGSSVSWRMRRSVKRRRRPNTSPSDETEDRNACQPFRCVRITNARLQRNNVVVVQGRCIPKEIHHQQRI